MILTRASTLHSAEQLCRQLVPSLLTSQCNKTTNKYSVLCTVLGTDDDEGRDKYSIYNTLSSVCQDISVTTQYTIIRHSTLRIAFKSLLKSVMERKAETVNSIRNI